MTDNQNHQCFYWRTYSRYSRHKDDNNITLSFIRMGGDTIHISLNQSNARHLKETLDEFINPPTANHGNKAEQVCERIDAAIESITHTIDEMNQAILRLVGPTPSEPHVPKPPSVAGGTPHSTVTP